MALRMIEMILEQKQSEELAQLADSLNVVEHRQIPLQDGSTLVRILLDAEDNETMLDLLKQKFGSTESNRAIILPVEATLPRVDAEQKSPDKKQSGRISREELFEDMKTAAQCSRVYILMTILSTLVAVVGLYQDAMVVLIGAMVMTPTLGPSMALSLATTLGDVSLLRRAVFTGVIGVGTSILLSILIGMVLTLEPSNMEVTLLTRVRIGNVAVALISGCAGALAFTTGVSATLIGVMVAVALLPPMVTFGMLMGSGQFALAMGALSLFLMNLICVNLAGVITFLIQGIRPATWWEESRAKKATVLAICLWVLSLAALATLIFLF